MPQSRGRWVVVGMGMGTSGHVGRKTVATLAVACMDANDLVRAKVI